MKRSAARLGIGVAVAIACFASDASAQRVQQAAFAHRPASSSASPTQGIAAEPCRRSVGHVATQLVFGVFGAWIGGIVPFLAIDDAQSPNRRVRGDAGYQRSANIAFALGSWAGAAVGVTFTGPLECRALAKAVIGAAVPSLFMLAGYDEPYLPLLGVLFGAPFQSIGATIGVGIR